MATKKELYLQARESGMTNEQIAEEYGVLTSTITRAIGPNPKNEKESNGMGNNDDEVLVPNTNEEHQVLKTKVVNCCDCGTAFSIPPAEQKFYIKKGYELPKRCPKCRKKREQKEEHICIDCGATFTIRLTEKEFFEKNGLHIPQRCPECREIKRKRNAEQDEQQA